MQKAAEYAANDCALHEIEQAVVMTTYCQLRDSIFIEK